MIDLQGFITAIRSPAPPPELSWRPVFVRLQASDCEGFADFCRENKIAVIDTIERQLRDLALVKLPSPQQSTRGDAFIQETLASGGAYGNWVYLPWEARIVHLLDRDDYFDVITNRNQDKITRHEQQELRTKRIGVIGLSVGGEAAVTLAQEHLCGEIALADFDRLDLSNLNRLNAGFDELGRPKSLIIARRIAKIDPYLQVRLFEDGLTTTNLQEFLDCLDLVIEECDSLQAGTSPRKRAFRESRTVCCVYRSSDLAYHAFDILLPRCRPYLMYVRNTLISREDAVTQGNISPNQ